MQRLQPELKKLQQKYKGDRVRLNQATVALYREHGVNPLSGFLPLLLQIPVLIVLYGVIRGLTHTIDHGRVAAPLYISHSVQLATSLRAHPGQMHALGINLASSLIGAHRLVARLPALCGIGPDRHRTAVCPDQAGQQPDAAGVRHPPGAGAAAAAIPPAGLRRGLPALPGGGEHLLRGLHRVPGRDPGARPAARISPVIPRETAPSRRRRRDVEVGPGSGERPGRRERLGVGDFEQSRAVDGPRAEVVAELLAEDVGRVAARPGGNPGRRHSPGSAAPRAGRAVRFLRRHSRGPGDAARAMTDETMVASSAPRPSPAMKLRSIFNTSTGKLFRYPSDAYPVPKSSMARRTPRARRRRRTPSVDSVSAARAPSVISSQTVSGRIPVRATIAATSSTRLGSMSCRGDRLTLTLMGSPPETRRGGALRSRRRPGDRTPRAPRRRWA